MLSTSFWVYIPSVLGVTIIAAIAAAGRREKTQAWFAVTTSLIGLWFFTQYIALILPYKSDLSKFFIELSATVSVWFAVTFYQFSVEYIHDKKMPRNIWLLAIALAVCFSAFNLCGLSILSAWGEDYGIVIESASPLYLLQIVFIMIVAGYALLRILLATVKLERGQRSRNYILIIAVGQALTISGIATFFFGNSIPAQVALSVSMLVMSAIILFGITKRKLLDVKSFVLRATAYSLTAAIVGILYVAPTMSVFMWIFKIPINFHSFVIATLFASLIAANYSKLQIWFNAKTSKIFFRDAYDPTEVIASLNAVLISTIDTRKIVSSAIKIVEKHIKPIYCFFVLPELGTKDDKNRMIGDTHEVSAEGIVNILSDKKYAHNFNRTVVTSELAQNLELRNMLMGLDVACVAQLTSSADKSSLGYMIVGTRKSGKAYSIADYQLIEAIASTLSIAMQNALHFEEIQRFNVTLQDRVDDATKKLKSINDKLKRMDETKDEFISMASHQLRTPLTSVKGYVSMVLDGDVGPISDQQRELLNQSFQSSQRMANLISDLLNLSRINTGKFVIELSPVDLRGVVTAELEQLREMAVDKNIKLTYDPPADFPTLMLDDGKMHQVVMNLIDNALYYTPAGGSVTVTLTETPTAVEFRVIDTGIGVPRDSERHLFTKMYRAENARRARPDGTGLGLFMVKKVVIEQKGAIIFETEEGKGSTFGFKFNKADHLVTEAAIKAAAA